MIKEGNTKDDKDVALKSKLSVLIYGGPGSGKTYFGATMPKPYFIFLDKEGKKWLQLNARDASYADVDTYQDVVQVLTEIQNGKRAQDRESIVFDHLTFLTQMSIDKVKKERNATQMTQQLWGFVSEDVRNVVRQVISLQNKFHVCMISHEQVEKDDMRGETIGSPNTVGKFTHDIGGYFNLFLYAKCSEVAQAQGAKREFKVYSINVGRYRAKDLLSLLNYEEPNDFQVILDKFKEGIVHARD